MFCSQQPTSSNNIPIITPVCADFPDNTANKASWKQKNMPPYTEIEEPVTPTYEPENSDAKDVSVSNDGTMSPTSVASELPEPPFIASPTRHGTSGERHPRRPRRKVKSMPINSQGAQDFFASPSVSPTSTSSSTRFERQSSAPKSFLPSTPDTLVLLPEHDIEEDPEEDAEEEPEIVSSTPQDVKAEVADSPARTARSSSSSPSSGPSKEKPINSNQVDSACSCVIL